MGLHLYELAVLLLTFVAVCGILLCFALTNALSFSKMHQDENKHYWKDASLIQDEPKCTKAAE